MNERLSLFLNLRVWENELFEVKSLKSSGEELSLKIRKVEVSKVAIDVKEEVEMGCG